MRTVRSVYSVNFPLGVISTDCDLNRDLSSSPPQVKKTKCQDVRPTLKLRRRVVLVQRRAQAVRPPQVVAPIRGRSREVVRRRPASLSRPRHRRPPKMQPERRRRRRRLAAHPEHAGLRHQPLAQLTRRRNGLLESNAGRRSKLRAAHRRTNR